MLTNLSMIKKKSYNKKMLKYNQFLMKLIKSNNLLGKTALLRMELYLEMVTLSENCKGKKVFKPHSPKVKKKIKGKIQNYHPVKEINLDLLNIFH